MKILPFLLVAFLGLGCAQPPVTIQFETETEVPSSASLTSTKVQIPAGIAVGVHARPMQSGQEMSSKTTLTFTPADSGVVGIAPSSQSDFSFVIYGNNPGTTTLTYSINGSPSGQIAVTVTAPISD